MAGLTGTQIKATYGDVLQCNHGGSGIDATIRIIQDGLGNNSALGVSTGFVAVQQSGGSKQAKISHDGTEAIFTSTSGNAQLGDPSTPVSLSTLWVTDVNTGALRSGVSSYQLGFTTDTGIKRVAAKVIAPTDYSTGAGWVQNTGGEAALAAAFTDALGALISTNLSVTVIAGRSYRFRAFLQVSNSNAADGAQFNFNGGTATATTFFAAAQVVGSVVAGTVVTTTLAGVLNWTTVTGTDYVMIEGYLKVNGGGTLTLQAATNTTVSGTMTLGAGSWLALWDTVSK